MIPRAPNYTPGFLHTRPSALRAVCRPRDDIHATQPGREARKIVPPQYRHKDARSKARNSVLILVNNLSPSLTFRRAETAQRFSGCIQVLSIVVSAYQGRSWAEYRRGSKLEPQKATDRYVGTPTRMSATCSQTSRSGFFGRSTPRQNSRLRVAAASVKPSGFSVVTVNGRAMQLRRSCRRSCAAAV